MFDIETWKFINTFAPWLSAIGTILAVSVSLHLAYTDRRIHLKLNASTWHIIDSSGVSQHEECVMLTVVNTGHRKATITGLGWKTGLFKKQSFYQKPPENFYSATLPVTIDEGEEAKWVFILKDDETNWIKMFSNAALLEFPRLKLFWLRFIVTTSVGKTQKARISKSLRDKLLEYTKESNKSEEPIKKPQADS